MQAVYVENQAEECVYLSVGQKLGTVHSMCIDQEAWVKEELRRSTAQDLNAEYDFPTEESRRNFVKDSFKIDENEILNREVEGRGDQTFLGELFYISITS